MKIVGRNERERETQIELAGEQCKEGSREKKANKVKGNGRGGKSWSKQRTNENCAVRKCGNRNTESCTHT